MLKAESKKIERILSKYQIGQQIKFSDDDPEDAPHTISGYKMIGGEWYVTFTDGCVMLAR